MNNGELLSRTESAALRGIAILGIILHNYCHFLGFAVKENEYKFDPARPMQFFDKLFSFDSDLFIHFFSFLGHYGVPVFLFISGYGLVKKYEAAPGGDGLAWAFIKKHFLKLFRLMFIGYLVFIGIYLLRHSDGAQVYSWDHVLTQLTMTINFFYFDPDHIIKPGPYWYFGLMLQLYTLYILVFHRWRQNRLLIAFAVGSILLEACFGNQQDWLNYIRYNFIGGLFPFCMGLWMARREPLSNSEEDEDEGEPEVGGDLGEARELVVGGRFDLRDERHRQHLGHVVCNAPNSTRTHHQPLPSHRHLWRYLHLSSLVCGPGHAT